MRITRTLVGVVSLTLVLLSTAAFAQPLPHENHYKAYLMLRHGITKDVALRDQFGQLTVTSLIFDRFSTPVQKIHNGITYPMVDPLIHLDWWAIHYPQPIRDVIVTDQFGQSLWKVQDARYLLLPSLKNAPVPGPPVPTWNHYLCYDVVTGPTTVVQGVTLIDQFGNATTQVRRARFLCNPVEKTVFGPGVPQVYPIIDATAHLAIYEINQLPANTQITAYDQFGLWQTSLLGADYLAVPALKDHPVPTTPSTWGKIKSLYRN